MVRVGFVDIEVFVAVIVVGMLVVVGDGRRGIKSLRVGWVVCVGWLIWCWW